MSRTLSRPPFRRPRLGLRLRRPAPFWLATVGLALVTALTVTGLVGSAQAEVALHGDLRPVLVARHDLTAGDVLGVEDAEVRRWPAAFVAEGALGEPAGGQVVASPVHAGEAVLAARLAPAGTSAVAALLPPGARGVAIPAAPGGLPLSVGDVVDVLATLETGDESSSDPTFPVARAAGVIDVGEEAVTLAVSAREAPRVAYALTAGAVTLALTDGTAALAEP